MQESKKKDEALSFAPDDSTEFHLTPEEEAKRFRTYKWIILFEVLNNGMSIPVMMIAPIYYKHHGFHAIAEFNVFMRYISIVIGSLSFSLLISKLNFGKGFPIFSLGFLSIPLVLFLSSLCIEYSNRQNICSDSVVQGLNVFFMFLSGVLGPCLMLSNWLYAEVVSCKNTKKKFTSFGAGIMGGAGFFGNILAIIIIPFTSDLVFFGIATAIGLIGTIGLLFVKDQDLSKFEMPKNIWLNVKSIFKEIHSSIFTKYEIILGMIDGTNFAASNLFFSRSLIRFLNNVPNKMERDTFKTSALSLMGFSALLVAYFASHHGKGLKNQHFLYIGFLVTVLGTVFAQAGYFTKYFVFDALAYLMLGFSTSFLKSGILLAISRNGYSLDRLSILRLSGTIMTSVSGAIGFFFLGYDGLLIFSIITILMCFVGTLIVKLTPFFKQE